MGIKEMLLDEDCNRCEGDVPDTKQLKVPKEAIDAKNIPRLPKTQSLVAGATDVGVVEGSSSDALDELKELLGE